MEETTAPVPEESEVINPKGITFVRYYTREGVSPFDTVNWVIRDAVIVDSRGNEQFRQDNVEVPESWSDLTTNIVAEKYFRVVNGKKEYSARQMYGRVVDWLQKQGVKQKLFRTAKDARIFHQELLYLLLHQMYAFNSPVWFNVGAVDDPQCSACFIQSVDDTMNDIMDLAKREVMLFKGGSGTGANLSPLRSSYEELSRGGYASGPVSFMDGFDAFAGATKSGGTTRRAAKMNVLNIDHPDILEQRNGRPGFIRSKSDAEVLAHNLYETGKYTAEWNKPGNVYDLVGFQNANHSVRVTDQFMEAVEGDEMWATIRKDGSEQTKYKARKLFDEIAQAAWICGDPGMQFDTSTNEWHTCKESGRINASNPCSEYLFLDETACNLGSLNLLQFADGDSFDIAGFEQACSVVTSAKEIIVDGSSYPSPRIAEMSHRFRTLGLGYSNLGALLTYWGLAYNSDQGRTVAASITSLMCASAYEQSALMAKAQGPFPEYEKNKDSMLEVIEKHTEAAKKIPRLLKQFWFNIVESSVDSWSRALEAGRRWGFRNAQTTNLAPTGTISFMMGCISTGVEPNTGVMVWKKIVGGGLLPMPNEIVGPALENLGYSKEQIKNILDHIKRKGDIHTAEDFDHERHGDIFADALGPNALPPEAHVDMMAAVQPFLSGGISKTVNMPRTATAEDIADIYMRAWRSGLKCIAVFRDGCKLSQPISTSLGHNEEYKNLKWGERLKLPATRRSVTHKFSVGGVEGYMHVGVYPDGTPGEIFLTVSKQGSFLSGIVDCFATALSYGLQFGAPLEDLVNKFKGMRFDPSGFTGDPDLPIAYSIVDYVAKWLERQFLLGDPEEIPEPVKEVSSSRGASQEASPYVSYDGPPCSECGNLTKRSGTCYLCSNCGTTTGCS